ncbi:MAG: ROK family protein [Kofleriaceae bacterium]
MTVAIGVDLGGSNLRVAAFAGDDPRPVCAHREEVGLARAPEAIVERIAAAVDHVARGAGVTDGTSLPVGVGLAAMLRDRRGTVANSPHLRWRDVAFGELLAARLGPIRPVGGYNDVNAITWGEHVAGAGVGIDDLLAVYVGTGIGAGVIASGRLLDGARHCAGEIGHVKVAWGDGAAPCACGQRGCVEAYVGGSYVAARIIAALSAARAPRTRALELAGGVPGRVTPGHVDQAAADGDDWALALWTELAPLLAVALGNALAMLNPARLILGGGLLSRTPTLRELTLGALMLAAPVAATDGLSIVDSTLGDDAGLLGAAHLAASGQTFAP